MYIVCVYLFPDTVYRGLCNLLIFLPPSRCTNQPNCYNLYGAIIYIIYSHLDVFDYSLFLVSFLVIILVLILSVAYVIKIIVFYAHSIFTGASVITDSYYNPIIVVMKCPHNNYACHLCYLWVRMA